MLAEFNEIIGKFFGLTGELLATVLYLVFLFGGGASVLHWLWTKLSKK